MRWAPNLSKYNEIKCCQISMNVPYNTSINDNNHKSDIIERINYITMRCDLNIFFLLFCFLFDSILVTSTNMSYIDEWVLTRKKKRCFTHFSERQELIYCNIVFRFIDIITRMTWLLCRKFFVMVRVLVVRAAATAKKNKWKKALNLSQSIGIETNFIHLSSTIPLIRITDTTRCVT